MPSDRVPVFKLFRAAMKAIKIVSEGIQDAKADDNTVSPDEAMHIISLAAAVFADVFE